MDPRPRDMRRAMAAVGVASAAVGYTTTAMTVGTRGMARDLSLSTVELGWVVNSYLLAAAALVLVGGRLGDVIGRLRTFAIGLAVFGSASLLGMAAPGLWALLLARVLQGVGAALILPTSIEVIAAYAPSGRESWGFRWRGLAYACSFAIGPLVGGVVTDWLSWRWIFVVDVVLMGVAAVAARPLGRRDGRGTTRATRDFRGAVLAAALVTVTVVLAERLAAWELLSIGNVLGVPLAAALAVLLVRHERRTEHPLLHPFVLRDRQVLGANVATAGASLGMLSLLYFFNLFAQSATAFDHAALSVIAALAPFFASMVLCAAFAHWLGGRVGPRGPVGIGLLLMVTGFALLATTSGGTARSALLLPLALSGVGAGIANASLTGLAVLQLPAGRINEAAGWNSLARFLGSAMALAAGTATYLSVTPLRSPGPEVTVADGSDAFDAAAATLARDLSGPVLAAARSVTAERFARSMLLTAILLSVSLVISWWLLRAPASTTVDDGTTPPPGVGREGRGGS